MRVLLNDFSGHPFQLQLGRSLAARGHEVLHTYCPSFLTPHGRLEGRDTDPSGFATEAVALDQAFEKYGLFRRWRQERLVGRRLVEIAARFRPDSIISANSPLGTQAALLGFARKNNLRFVFWLQDLYGIGIAKALRRRIPVLGKVLGLGFQGYERRLLAQSTQVVAITRDFLPYLPKTLAPEQVSVIGNWAPLDDLPVLPKANAWSIAHELDDKLCIVYAGTLGMKHNPDLLLALAEQMRSRKQVRIVVISEGVGAEYLAREKKARGIRNLVQMGFQPFENMPSVLATADVLVAILECDAGQFAVPSKVLTYLCANRALLLAVPNDNLAARIVAENQAGLVVSPDDQSAFVAAAERLVANDDVRAALAHNGRAYAETTFDIERITDRFERIVGDGVKSTRLLGRAGDALR